MLQKIEILVVGILTGAVILELFRVRYARFSMKHFAKISLENDWGKPTVFSTLIELDKAIKKAEHDLLEVQGLKPSEQFNNKRLLDEFFQITDLARNKLEDERKKRDNFIATAILSGKSGEVWTYLNQNKKES
jgi:hypothetical protein